MSISMNLSSERKHNMKSLLTVISLALALVSPAFAGIEWGFPDSLLSVNASVGTGTATITLGTYGQGWFSGTTTPWTLGSSVPGATGLWDLGQGGSIVLNNLSGSGLTILNVFQWVNPGTYSGTLNFAVSDGGSSGGLSVVTQIGSAGPDGGAWWEYAANLGALMPGQTVTVTAPGGAVIDRLALVPEPATLIAGAILLIPFAVSTWHRRHRRRRS